MFDYKEGSLIWLERKKIVTDIDGKMDGRKKKLRFLKTLILERNKEIKILF